MHKVTGAAEFNSFSHTQACSQFKRKKKNIVRVINSKWWKHLEEQQWTFPGVDDQNDPKA